MNDPFKAKGNPHKCEIDELRRQNTFLETKNTELLGTIQEALTQIEEWRDLASSMGGLDDRIQANSEHMEEQLGALIFKYTNSKHLPDLPELVPDDAGELALSEQIYHYLKEHYTYSQCVFITRQFRAAGWTNTAYDPDNPLVLAKGQRAGVDLAIQHLQDLYIDLGD